MRRIHSRRDRGAALIFALGILACLTLLATAFATLTQVELRASRNYRDGERATYIAISGIERAKFELRRSVSTPGYPLPWLLYEPAASVQNTMPELDFTTNPQNPSFKHGFATVPAILQQNPPKLPYPSGFVASTYYRDPTTPEMLGDYYSLRVTECNAQVYLNDKHPHLGMMINSLAWALAIPNPTNIATKILTNRPPSGFRRVEELKALLTPDEYTAIKGYVTCHAYVDRKVIESGPQPNNTNPALVTQPRAPININLAPMPVLVAALAGVGYIKPTLVLMSPQKAVILAQEIIAYRANPTQNFGQGNPNLGNPPSRRFGFASWPEYAAFLANSPTVKNDPLMCAALLANANPNTDLNGFVPDACMWHPIDKLDLAGATTEFRFGSGGVFSIESLGVVLGPDGVPVAASKMRSSVCVFNEYCDTSQADFEVDRLDPNGVAGYPGLRDITTGPEWRNAQNANLTGATADEDGLLAARYDGHLTFNAITRTDISPQGGFAGFIDRTIQGNPMQNVSGKPCRTIGTPNAGPLVVTPQAPVTLGTWMTGTDLLPMGAYTGRGGRQFCFDQDPAVPTTTHDIPKVVMSTTPIDYIVTTTTTTTTPQWEVDTSSGSAVVKPLPDLVTVTSTDTPQQLPAESEPVPAYSYDAVDKMGFEMWFKPAVGFGGRQELLNWESGGPELATQVLGKSYNWGKKATLAVWIVPDATPPAGTSYTLHCKFEIEGTPYSREWIYGVNIRAGTWHHILFSFWVPKPGQTGSPPEHTMFFVDGQNTTSVSAEPNWPTETLAQALAMRDVTDALIARAQAAVVAAGISGALVMSNPINTSDPIYQVPVQFPRGVRPVCFAGDQAVFTGLVDNLIIQGNWAKKMSGNYNGEQYLPRFDSYRPSAGGASNGSALAFQKRAQALEWDRPIRIVACDATAWKTNPAADGGELMIGNVYTRFGWQSGTGSSFPSLGQTYGAGASSGWTPQLNSGAPFNAVASGYLVPDRGQNNGQPRGFLTKTNGELELYAVEISPTTDSQSGPRMAPIVDDVRIIYMPWDVVTVLEEVEIVD